METKQEGSNKNDKEEHKEEFIAFDQGDYIESMNEKLVASLLPTTGICSALCDLYIYYYFKHELSGSTPKKYKNFIDYLNTKLGYDTAKLEKVAKFINVIHSIGNSGYDAVDKVATAARLKSEEEINENIYIGIKEGLDKLLCLKISYENHDIVIVKDGDKYGYFNANGGVGKNLSYESLTLYLKEMNKKHKLSRTLDNGFCLPIHYGKERIEAIFKNEDGKQALRELFDNEKTYLDHLDALKTESYMVKDHASKIKARVTGVQTNINVDEHIKKAQERNKNYEQSKAKLATFVTDNKTNEFDLTGYQAHGVVLILKDMLQSNNLSVKKLSLKGWRQLNINNIELLEKIIKTNKDIIFELGENTYNQEQALTLINDINVYHTKYVTKAIKNVAYNVIEANNILSKKSTKIIFNKNYSEVLLDFLVDHLFKEEKIESLDISKRMNQQEYQALTKIVKEKNIEMIYFYKDFQCNEEFKEAIIENKNIKAIKLRRIKKINEQAIDIFKDILIKNSSITKVDLSCNNNITNDMFISIFESISKNNNITSLMLDNNSFDDKAVAKLIEMIKANNIKELNIENIKISDQAAEKLFEALKENTSITNIDIAEVKKISTKQIGKLLEKNQYSSIRIGSSDFRDGKGNPVFDAIGENKALNRLEVSWCEFDDQAKNAFIKALKANTSIKSITIYGEDNKFNKQVKDIIAERNEKPTSITSQASVSNKNAIVSQYTS